MKIAIYGVGKTGREIVKELRNKKNVELIKIHKRTLFKRNKLAKSDLIVLCAGNLSKLLGKDSKSPYEVRVDETKLNKGIINEFVNLYFGLKIPIIVLTNQSNMWEKYLRKKLKSSKIFAFGESLDKERYCDTLGREVEVVGPHGLTIPLLKSNKKGDYLKSIKKEQKMMGESFSQNDLNYNFIGKNFAKNYLGMLKEKKRKKLNKIERDLLEKVNLRFKKDYEKIFK